jgi:molybdenum cofactor cytidylyltransferase
MPEPVIAAVILAAGQSRRMGEPKMILPWGKTTVIGQVVTVLEQAGVQEIVVVAGGAHAQVSAALQRRAVSVIYNDRYAEDHMLLSLQAGIRNLTSSVSATLVALGDQPQIQVGVVQAVVQSYRMAKAPLIVPSYQMRRGHPWLVARPLWEGILALKPPQTMRDVLQMQASHIHYVLVDNDSILRDLDTPADYSREHPPGE